MKTKRLIHHVLRSTLVATGLTLASTALFAQVKIGTNPTVIDLNNNLEVEAGGGNKTVIRKTTGNVGIGNADPSNQLHVTSPADPVRLEGLTTGVEGDVNLVVDATGVVKKAPAGLISVTRFLASMSASGTQALPTNASTQISFQSLDFETISGSTNLANGSITVPRTGFYQILSNIHPTDVPIGGTIGYCVYYRKNGVVIPAAESCGRNPASNGRTASSFAYVMSLNAGDVISSDVFNVATATLVFPGSSLQVIELR